MMLIRMRALTRSVKGEIEVWRLVLRDARTPWIAKLLLGAAVGYLLLPFDLIPDFIPVIGQLDDVLIVPGLIIAARHLIPDDVLADCRAQAHQPARSRNSGTPVL